MPRLQGCEEAGGVLCYNSQMMNKEERHVMWERRQAELWDRIFQVTQDVVVLSETLSSGAGLKKVRDKLLDSALAVGEELVHANAADTSGGFEKYLDKAKIRSIETDYWLRLIYVIEQASDVQRDLSSIISQYSAIIMLLQKFIKHAHDKESVVNKHAKGPWVS